MGTALAAPTAAATAATASKVNPYMNLFRALTGQQDQTTPEQQAAGRTRGTGNPTVDTAAWLGGTGRNKPATSKVSPAPSAQSLATAGQSQGRGYQPTPMPARMTPPQGQSTIMTPEEIRRREMMLRGAFGGY